MTQDSFDEAQITFCALKCSYTVHTWHLRSGRKHVCIRPKNYILNIWLRTKVGCLETPRRVCGELQISQQQQEEARSDASLWAKPILFSAWRRSPSSLLGGSVIWGWGWAWTFYFLNTHDVIKYACGTKQSRHPNVLDTQAWNLTFQRERSTLALLSLSHLVITLS